VQYLFRVAQNLSNGGNISSILSPELERLSKETLSTDKLNLLSKNSNFKDFGKFYLQRFESNEALDNYISSADYGWGDKKGVCFGFKVIENRKNDYEVELMF